MVKRIADFYTSQAVAAAEHRAFINYVGGELPGDLGHSNPARPGSYGSR